MFHFLENIAVDSLKIHVFLKKNLGKLRVRMYGSRKVVRRIFNTPVEENLRSPKMSSIVSGLLFQ